MSVLARLLIAFVVLPTCLWAQERPSTILVLDGSGSMWGQIDGINKIVIARDVVGEIFQDFPADQNLGLTVYGHRVEGDCTDIETVVPPGPGTAGEIIARVGGINPRGKTPMTDAIVAAAEALGYAEAPATVVLISDGIETCHPDPCAAARALEEAGANFTAHIIGFDVADSPEALEQMRCVANATGGSFTLAKDAAELRDALTLVVDPNVAPPVPVTFEARLLAGEMAGGAVTWTVEGANGAVAEAASGNPFVLDLTPGDYTATAVWAETSEDVTASFVVADDASTVTLTFAPPVPEATLDAPERVPAASSVSVAWTGPGDTRDAIELRNDQGAPVASALVANGNPVSFDLPARPGAYELRYLRAGRVPLASRTLTLDPIPLDLDAPDAVTMGQNFEVTWTGPGRHADSIRLGLPGQSAVADYAYLTEGNPVMLTAPNLPGSYELSYVFEDSEVLLRRVIEVLDVEATLSHPGSAQAGSRISVDWDGPGLRNDFIAVARPADISAINYSYTRNGNPADLLLPAEPGTYEIRYVLGQGQRVIARSQIEVTPVTAALDVPAEAEAGATFRVGWEGPGYRNDFIGIGRPGNLEDHPIYSYTRDGNPATLVAPSTPGDYEVRYYMAQDRRVLASAPLTVTSVTGSVSAPETANAGEAVLVSWTGPDYRNDFIAVGKPGDDAYLTYEYTRNGDPLSLRMPTEPGSYEVRYYMRQDQRIIARQPIEVTGVTASLSAPETAPAGEDITVDWTGPAYRDDFIAIGTPDDDAYLNYSYTRNGNPATLTVPVVPGTYEVRYYMRQDRRILARQTIEVTDVVASVAAADSAPAGAPIEVEWSGPDYRNDFIGVGKPGEDRYINYAYTRSGTPVELQMPTEPGDYEIRYYLRQGNEILARRPITLTALDVTLSGPETAAAGSTVSVTWDGPDYTNDFIGIGLVDDSRYTAYAYTRNGNPVEVVMPSEPGSYELRYYLRQGNEIVARQRIEVTDVTATLDAATSGPAGGTLSVGFDGPEYANDFIGIGRSDNDRYEVYTYVRRGNPIEIALPDTPGEYELRYYMRQDNRILARQPLTVLPAE